MSEIVRKIVGVFSFKDEASKDIKDVDKSMDGATDTALSMQGALAALGGVAVLAALKSLASVSLDAAAALETQQVRLKNLSGEGYPELLESVNATIEASQGLSNEGDLSTAVNSALRYGASIDLLKGSMGSLQKLSAITGDDLSSMFQGVAADVATGSTRFLKQNAILSKHLDAFKALGAGYDEATKKKRELFIVDVLQKEQLAIQQQYNATMETTNALLAVGASQWGNVKERLGGMIMDGFKPLLKLANRVLRFLGETEKGLAVLKIATAVLVPVIGVLLVAAFYSAAAAAWAFVTPLLPFIAIGLLIVAAITAIILIVQDLITYFQGGESVIGEFIEKVKAWFFGLRDSIMDVVNGVIDAFLSWPRTIIGLVQDAFNWLKDSVVGKLILKLIPDMEARQYGGPVMAGESYLVGENGPELFTPKHSGAIIPNGSFAQTGGGTSINTQGGARVTIRNMIETLTINVTGPQEAADAVRTAVLDTMNDLSRNVFRAELGLEVT